MLWGACAAAAPGAPARVLVVRSSAHPSFGAAIAGIRATCACEPGVVELEGEELADGRLLGDSLAADPAIVVALGERAAELVSYARADAPFLAALAPVAPEDLPGGRGVRGAPEESLEVDQILKLGGDVKRIGVLYDPAASRKPVERLERAVRKRGLAWVATAVPDAAALPRALGGLLGQVDAVVAMPDRSVVASQEAISHLVLRCIEANVLLYTRSEPLVKGGALCTLVVDPREVGELLGKMIADVLRGDEKVADLPWVSPTFRLVLNLKTGRALELSLPDVAEGTSDVVQLPVGAASGPLAGFVPAHVARSSSVPRPAGAPPGDAVVVLRVRISETGRLGETTVLAGEAPFTEAASAAVEGWSFAPATEEGRKVASTLVLTVTIADGR